MTRRTIILLGLAAVAAVGLVASRYAAGSLPAPGAPILLDPGAAAPPIEVVVCADHGGPVASLTNSRVIRCRSGLQVVREEPCRLIGGNGPNAGKTASGTCEWLRRERAAGRYPPPQQAYTSIPYYDFDTHCARLCAPYGGVGWKRVEPVDPRTYFEETRANWTGPVECGCAGSEMISFRVDCKAPAAGTSVRDGCADTFRRVFGLTPRITLRLAR